MNGKRIATYAFLFLAVLAVSMLVKKIAVVAISVVVAAGVAWWVSREATAASTAPEADAETGLPEWVEALRGLAALNGRVREQACPQPVIEELESIIDELRRLIPDLNTGYVGSELTWTVNRMASDYVARIVEPYGALSDAAKSENQAEFLRSLVGLEAELSNIESLVGSAKESEFKAKAAFLRARFLEDPG